MSEIEESKVEQPAPPVARIVSPREREKMVPIVDPVEFDGKIWTEIRIRRVSGKDIVEFSAACQVAAATDREMPLPPVIDCPREVWDALDADDQASVDDAAQAFMPRRLKAVAEQLGIVIGALVSD